MAKPVYNAISRYSPDKPVVVFVPTRKQAKLTAIDILSFAASDRKGDRFALNYEDDMKELLQELWDRLEDKVSFLFRREFYTVLCRPIIFRIRCLYRGFFSVYCRL